MQTKDSRPAQFRSRPCVRRRRLCTQCGNRITTYEITEDMLINTEAHLMTALRIARQTYRALGILLDAAPIKFPDGTAPVIERDGTPLDPHPAGE